MLFFFWHVLKVNFPGCTRSIDISPLAPIYTSHCREILSVSPGTKIHTIHIDLCLWDRDAHVHELFFFRSGWIIV